MIKPIHWPMPIFASRQRATFRRAQRAILRLGCALCLVVGCGPPPTVTATGKVLRNGQPIALSSTGVIQLALKPPIPADQQFTTIPGRCEQDGSFTIPDVPPGRYVFGIEILDPTPQIDKLNGTLNYMNSKIKRDIDGKAPISIDVAKPE